MSDLPATLVDFPVWPGYWHDREAAKTFPRNAYALDKLTFFQFAFHLARKDQLSRKWDLSRSNVFLTGGNWQGAHLHPHCSPWEETISHNLDLLRNHFLLCRSGNTVWMTCLTRLLFAVPHLSSFRFSCMHFIRRFPKFNRINQRANGSCDKIRYKRYLNHIYFLISVNDHWKLFN